MELLSYFHKLLYKSAQLIMASCKNIIQYLDCSKFGDKLGENFEVDDTCDVLCLILLSRKQLAYKLTMYMDFYVVVVISAHEVSEQVAELGNHVGHISCSAFVGVLRITALSLNKLNVNKAIF